MAKTSWLVIHWSSTMSCQRHTIIDVMCRMICQQLMSSVNSSNIPFVFCGYHKDDLDHIISLTVCWTYLPPTLSPSCRPCHSYGGHTGLHVVLRLTYLTIIWVFFSSTFFAENLPIISVQLIHLKIVLLYLFQLDWFSNEIVDSDEFWTVSIWYMMNLIMDVFPQLRKENSLIFLD